MGIWTKMINWAVGGEVEWEVKYEDLPRHLATNNKDLIAELFKLIQSALGSESDRTKAIDAKAASLFSLIGIMGSAGLLAFSSKGAESFGAVAQSKLGMAAIVILLVLLLFAIGFIFLSVKVSETKSSPRDADLFASIKEHDGRLRVAEQLDGGCVVMHPDPMQTRIGEVCGTEDGHSYRRYLAEHYWKLHCELFVSNQKKAVCLAKAQKCVFSALCIIIVFQIGIVYFGYMDKKNSASKIPQSSVPAAQPKASPQPPSPPPPLKASGMGRVTRDSVTPAPLRASSSGQSHQLSEGIKKKGNAK